MSFQGDVAGIGLGELLQGLARGGRDGVLSLYGDDVTGAIGLKGGVLHLLSAPDEDEDLWRERSLRAWADRADPLLEGKRREAIARAERLETFFRMLETSNLHFRFEPGPLPMPPGRRAGEDEEPWGQGRPVEYLLLEHARLTDEATATAPIEAYDVPRAIGASRYPSEVRAFLEECDGRSTLQEIADRLGWPLRQCRARVHEHYAAGAVRLAQPRELLAAAQRELAQGRIGRAAKRLEGWVRSGPPGPPPVGDAEMLVAEWERGRLAHVLPSLAPRDARAILRKLDRVHVDGGASSERWQRLHEAHRSDELTALHACAVRLVEDDEPDVRSFNELLRLARAFQERGQATRTRTLLRLASSQLPARPQTRAEIGRRMLDTGLVEEGTRWLLEVARELLAQGDGERALGPVRSVLKRLPDHGDAHGLLIQARAIIARNRRRRWKSLVALSVALILSLAGLVHVRMRWAFEARLDEVERALGRPEAALDLLELHFPGSNDDRVNELRSMALGLKKERDDARVAEWTERYEAVEEECELGDPVLGLRRALELPAPPEVPGVRRMRDRQELLDVLSARLLDRRQELDVPVGASVEDLHAEQRLLALVEQLRDMAAERSDDPGVESFHLRMATLHDEIAERRERRASERQVALQQQIEKEQDMLLGAARAHEAAGDLERAVATYERLRATEGFEELQPLLAEEMDRVRVHYDAVQEAHALAQAGDHEAAIERLEEGCPGDPSEHLLPWRVTSFPDGARARFPDGRSRVTPFQVHSGLGERVELRFELAGFEDAVVVADRPGDRVVRLHREPDRRLADAERVDAVPVPVGDDHVVADRRGRVHRIASDGRTRWRVSLDTLAGFTRTPVFLPRRPGHLLVVSAEGLAWLVEASDGDVEGPFDLGSPPHEGPRLTRRGVWARLEDGRVAIWEERLAPELLPADASFVVEPGDAGSDGYAPSTLAVLRRSPNVAPELDSPWTGWTAEVREDHVLVLGPDGRGFTASRDGDWRFLAWEAPKALLPMGRLWLSDGAGLRSYRPDDGPLVAY